MLRVAAIRSAGHWTPPAADWAVLDYDQRRRRRRSITTEAGLVFLLDMPAVITLHDGDGLELEDGRTVGVRAKPEDLLEITCPEPRHLARIAWHLGNRHLPAEILERAIRIRADHVIAEMARGLGAEVIAIAASFDPERGAYAGGSHHHHADDHDHDHPHDHAHA